MLILNPLFLQKFLRKSYQHKVQELCTFSLFDTVYKSSQPSHVLFVNFLLVFLNRFKLSIKLIPKSKSVVTKYFLGHISIFCKLLYQIPTKSIIKSKNVFHKCVLEFNFASIFKSGLFIFSKKVKIIVAYCGPILVLAAVLAQVSLLIQNWSQGEAADRLSW